MAVVSKKTNARGTTIYIVKTDMTPESANKLGGTYVDASKMTCIISHNADVYDEHGALILRFRKRALPLKHIKAAYDAIIDFARYTTSTRGVASGSVNRKVDTNKDIASNIMGYFDWWTIRHRHMFKTVGLKQPPFAARVTRFTHHYADKWTRVVPLIKDVDRMYKRLVPKCYAVQKQKASETAYTIEGTAFSTITTNLNVVTAIHKDRGNIPQSFGNLIVIENGLYKGGYTCYPEYGIGVDVRTGDFLAMDVHRWHGNTNIVKETDDAERLSIVCYLRQSIWEKTKGSTQKEIELNMRTMEEISKKYISIHRQRGRGDV